MKLINESVEPGKPEIVRDKPKIVPPIPEIVPQEPDIVPCKPVIVPPEPSIVKNKPEIVSLEPKIVPGISEIVPPAPKIVPPKPGIVPLEPEIVPEISRVSVVLAQTDETDADFEKDSPRPKKRKRKKVLRGKYYQQYATKIRREKILSRAKVAVTNALEYPEIRRPIIQWGYKKRDIIKGRTLYQKAETLLNKKDRKYTELKSMTLELKETTLTGRGIYIKHLKLARIVIPVSNKEYRVALGLRGKRPISGPGWLDKARLFYDNALGTPGVLSLFQTVGLTEEKLREGVVAMRAIELVENQRAKMKGIAREATRKRDEAFESLCSWLDGFSQVCRIVFPSGPGRQTLERLGIPAITTKKKKKKDKDEMVINQDGTPQGENRDRPETAGRGSREA